MKQNTKIALGTKGLAILALCAGLTGVANAIPTEISASGAATDEQLNGTGPGGGNGNSPSDDFFRLQTVVTGYNSVPGALAPLPTPVLAGDNTSGTANDSFASGGLSGFDYAVIHYGSGPGGSPSGGVEVFTSMGLPASPSPRMARDPMVTVDSRASSFTTALRERLLTVAQRSACSVWA